MKLYSYVVARDYGFAPNPFYGTCTLATCKPSIRRTAQVNDWIVGTGSKHYGLQGRIVYVMVVAETLTYDEYWENLRFLVKRPNIRGSLKQAYGDNIYHHDPEGGRWIQENSHHSLDDGSPNEANIRHDTKANRVLLATDFTYWGGHGPSIPSRFRDHQGFDVCCGRGHKCNFPEDLVDSFGDWVRSLGENGFAGAPKEFG